MTATLVLDGMRVPVETGGGSRRARLTIERDGSLRLRAAEDVAPDELQDFLASKRDWIYKKLAEKEELRYEPVTKELVNGEGLLYLGRSYRLRVTDDAVSESVRMERGRLCLPQPHPATDIKLIIGWYQRRGDNWLRPHVEDWASRLHVFPTRLDVADLGHRWGATSPDGHVRIHWAAMQLPPTLIDYVLAHELAHLDQPHHGPAFWQLLARVMPDYEQRKDELGRVGASVWLGAIGASVESRRK